MIYFSLWLQLTTSMIYDCASCFIENKAFYILNPSDIKNETQFKAYNDVLQKYVDEGYKDFAVDLIRLDNDDIYELVIILGDRHGPEAILYTFIGDKAVQIASESEERYGNYGSFTYYEGQNLFMSDFESVGGFPNERYAFYETYYCVDENGKAIIKDSFQSEYYETYNDDFELQSTSECFYLNDNEVTKGIYKAKQKKYSEYKCEKTVHYCDCIHISSSQDIMSFWQKE